MPTVLLQSLTVAMLCGRGEETNVRLHATLLTVVFKSSIMFCKGHCAVIARLFETGSVVLIDVFIQHTFIHFLSMSCAFPRHAPESARLSLLDNRMEN